MNWYLAVLRNYVGFAGRARRTEFWWFYLVNFIVSGLLSWWSSRSTVGTVINVLYGLFILLPSLAVGARRLHDSDRSGWWLLIGLIPVVGWIVLLVLFLMPGTAGPNRHGPDPRQLQPGAAPSWAGPAPGAPPAGYQG